MIEAQAKRRLADEYDAAQRDGLVATSHDGRRNGREVYTGKPTRRDLGLSDDHIHEARAIRDAEVADPGIVQRTVDEAVANREPKTRCASASSRSTSTAAPAPRP